MENSNLGWQIGNIRGAKPVEIRIKMEYLSSIKAIGSALPDHISIEYLGEHHDIDIEIVEETSDGYRGVHISFIIPADVVNSKINDTSKHTTKPIGLELQLFTPETKEVRETTAAAIFYKLEGGLGEVADIKRKMTKLRNQIRRLNFQEGYLKPNDRNEILEQTDRYYILKLDFEIKKADIVSKVRKILERWRKINYSSGCELITSKSYEHLMNLYQDELKKWEIFGDVKDGLEARITSEHPQEV